jgi:spermidine/putrescine transport system permease protein
MYTKLQAGDAYDLLIPSDYMIERLIKEDYLQPIDWSLISNADSLNPDILDKEYDPGNVYSVPYFWGNVGILYDTTVVDEEDLADGWNLLMNTKYAGNLYMYDSERDSFMIALKALGYSMNTHDEDEIQEAYQWLLKQRDTMKPIYAGDDVIDNMISGNKALAVVYSGDGAYIMSENENLGYLEPEEGTNLWYDAMVITKDCENVELAHEFIDFILQEDVAQANTEYVGYSSPVLSVYEYMQEEDYAGINAYVPRVDYENDEIFRYQETNIKKLFAELWTKVKAQ